MVNGSRVAIIDGVRTPFAKAGGQLAELSMLDLSVAAVGALAERNSLDGDAVTSVVLGSVYVPADALYLARQTAIALGWSSTDAYSAECACATGARTVVNAAYQLLSGEHDVAIAGGAESLSNRPVEAPPAVRDAILRSRSETGALEALMATTLRHLVPPPPTVSEPYTGKTLGEHAEEMVAEWGVSRAEADAFAVASHRAAATAAAESRLDGQIVPVRTSSGALASDTCIRPDTSPAAVAALQPVFATGGVVTAANASPLTDGASAVLLANEAGCRRLGVRPRAVIRAWAFTSQAPEIGVLIGPVFSLARALDRAGLELADLDLLDLHEAFAGQVLANLRAIASDEFGRRHLGRAGRLGEVYPERLNVNGGSISLGHPFGATGGRLLTQLVNELERRDGRYGAIAICAGGSRGGAIVVERGSGV